MATRGGRRTVSRTKSTQASDTLDPVFADDSGTTLRGAEYVDAFQLYKPLAGFRKPVGTGNRLQRTAI
jgi:hypothetical protein